MGFASESRERSRPVLPLAGMVDVLFLLLIFFMSTYSMRDQELEVDIGLPGTESGEPGTVDTNRIIVSFDEEGQVYLGRRVVPVDELSDELASLVEASYRDPVLLVRGDAEADHGLLLKIIDEADEAGLGDVRLLGAAVEEGE